MCLQPRGLRDHSRFDKLAGRRARMESQREAAPSEWPLGLSPDTFQTRLTDVFNVAESNFLQSTISPTISSMSSSDFDTESNFSFYRERSISLGSLIGMDTRDPSLRYSGSTLQCEIQRLGTQSKRNVSGCDRLRSFLTCINPRNLRDDCAPTLGNLLRAERNAAEACGAQKVYINIMYEESNRFGPEMNPLFRSGSTAMRSDSTEGQLPMIMEDCPEMSSPSTRRSNYEERGTERSGTRTHRNCTRNGESECRCACSCVFYLQGTVKSSCKGNLNRM